jgi:O-antigen ligase
MLAALRKNFDAIRYSLGITMVFNGHPIIFFFRDSLQVVPLGSAFTVAFWTMGMMLMIPSNFRFSLYKPNYILLQLSLAFWALTMAYFFLFNPIGKSATDMGYTLYIFMFYLLILCVPNTIQTTFIKVIFWVSMFSNLTLIYSLSNNPDWFIGVRASYMFANAPGHAGNPHIPARNAIMTIISAGILLWKCRIQWQRIFYYCALMMGVVIICLTIARSTILALVFMGMIYMVSVLKDRSASEVFKSIFSFRTFKNLTLIGITVYIIVFQYFKLGDILNTYNEILLKKFYDIALTSLNVELAEEATEDASAMGRVRSFSHFSESLDDPLALTIGEGYKKNFMDVPILEAWMNQGILGFILFNTFLVFLGIFSIMEIWQKRSETALFAAYLFMYTVPQMLTGGRPQDITYWFSFIIMIRFLGIRYLESDKQTLKLFETPLRNKNV